MKNILFSFSYCVNYSWRFYAYTFSLLIIFSLLSSCTELSSGRTAQDINSLRLAISDKGVINIDRSNPYLAVNQLLESELKFSPTLAGFISIRGEPNSLEIVKEKNNTFLIKLYYTDSFQRYELTMVENQNYPTDWAIAGPFPDQSVVRAVITPTTNKTPESKPKKDTFNYWPTPTPFPTPSSEPTESFLPTPKNDAVKNDAVETLAEISPRGDLVHYVTMPKETVSIIARWYTEELENTGKIARLNQLKNPDLLQIGDSIVIPSYLVKNKKKLTQEYLDKILNESN